MDKDKIDAYKNAGLSIEEIVENKRREIVNNLIEKKIEILCEIKIFEKRLIILQEELCDANKTICLILGHDFGECVNIKNDIYGKSQERVCKCCGKIELKQKQYGLKKRK